ncbi:MAG TPA: M14 family zinc carboxypeptidase, partial [Candidatus Dormibacteraeota bacterium]|nr:M14 family zinc carboxypeptidase [Candidatus Dormibacteraeota bacterium]
RTSPTLPADYLLKNPGDSVVRDLLANADIWVIPQSNPAGRAIDDLRWGDPTQFIAVCSAGDPGKLGVACRDDADCGATGECLGDGWRANANRTDCAWGVDPARNFSSGWNDAAATCEAAKRCDESGALCNGNSDCASGNCANTIMKYRGLHPFSEPETLNLRRFVNNHMISMAAIAHTNGQEVSNRWRPVHGPSHFMTDELGSLSATGSSGYSPDPKLRVGGVGGGYGQFSAWLTQYSDVRGDDGPDFATARNISTFYFELPIKGGANYYGTAYENSSGDGSNSFHPSSDKMKSLWEDAIRDLFLYVIRQARSPQCPVDDSGNRLDAQCLGNDLGLVGAKLAAAEDEPGLLDYDAATREEILPHGTHRVVFAVQNFSASPGTPLTGHAWVFITKDGALTSETVDISLSPGQRQVYSVSHDFEPGVYRVQITLIPDQADDFSNNNTKIFAFRVASPYSLPARIVLGVSLSQVLGTDGTLSYRGRFAVERQLEPGDAELRVVLHGHRADLPASPSKAERVVSYLLPPGPPWWDQSAPAKGLWIYSDPNGVNGGVRGLIIRQTPVQSSDELATEVLLRVEDGSLKQLAGAQAYRTDFDLLGDNQRLSSLASGKRLDLPSRSHFPEEEAEEEPDSVGACPGDCNADGDVSIDELIRGVNIALGDHAVDDCLAFDGDASGQVDVAELVRAVNAALNGCPRRGEP